jgi:hypothetical protein
MQRARALLQSDKRGDYWLAALPTPTSLQHLQGRSGTHLCHLHATAQHSIPLQYPYTSLMTQDGQFVTAGVRQNLVNINCGAVAQHCWLLPRPACMGFEQSEALFSGM